MSLAVPRPARRSPRLLPMDPALAIALGVSVMAGVAIGLGSTVALYVLGAFCAVCAMALPLGWLAALTVAGGLAYRLVAPTATGPASLVPDALLALTVVKGAVQASVGRLEGSLEVARRIAVPLALLAALATASAIINGDPALTTLVALRQFGRFPLWAACLCAAGLSWSDGRRLLRVLLILSLVQLPVALYQTVRPPANPFRDVVFYPGDNVSGTFGIGGSNTEMVFLVICALVWLSLVLHRRIGAWTLWALAPVLVVPMALGSAAAFLILLPSALLALLVRSATARSGPRIWGALVGGVVLVAIGVVAARSLSLAPGFAGAPPPGAGVILQPGYLSKYLSATTATGQHTRLGFLHLAVETDARDGWRGLLLGQGPTEAVIGEPGLQVGATRVSVLARSSVQSAPRLLLGFGFPALVVFSGMALLPLVGLRRRWPRDGTARAVIISLPIAAAVFLVAGIYNAPWTDPGIAAAYWTLVVAAEAGSERPADAGAIA